MKHIFFSGIGGTGIGPLALIAKQAGYSVSGSDKQESQYTNYLQKQGIDLYIGQTAEKINQLHQEHPIDWFVYTSALPLENPNHPELLTVHKLSIKHSKRDEFLQQFLIDKHLKLIAFAGTHGKTSSTAMAIWVAKQLRIPISYSVGAKLTFGDMGHYDKDSEYFIYECDEFDKNFLAYNPYVSVLTKVDWDHHEQYPSRAAYIAAFQQFVSQSNTTYAHQDEVDYLQLNELQNVHLIDSQFLSSITLAGDHNRRNGAGVITAMQSITKQSMDSLISAINSYPGSNRRFEKLAPNIYTDYAHTPEEIAATLQLARENSDKIVVIYEPLTNRRQHYMKDYYKDVFINLHALYWVPSYLAREDPAQNIITPSDFIETLNSTANARAAQKDDNLVHHICDAIKDNCTILFLAGGGGDSLDEWARKHLAEFKD